MSHRSVYDITTSVEGVAYRQVIDLVAELSSTFGLMLRSAPSDLLESGRTVLRQLEPYLESREAVGSWPGSQLYGDMTYDRYLYVVEAASVQVLIRSASRLFDWVNPRLPEDLHFLRADGSTVLGMVAQEDDAWLELTNHEYDELLLRMPKEVDLRDHG